MLGCEKMVQLAITLVFSLYLSYVEGQVVNYIGEVELHGKIITTRNGRNISAYMGLPYAKPPVGPLRFKSPVLWTEDDANETVIMADTDGNQCPQLSDDGELAGDEDCLNLNVYTPQTSPEVPYPTMVYFFGIDFVQGSASSKVAGPEYMLDRDVVLVTVNYRLGALGFLSTGDAEAPGNFGLKDQVASLQWVRKYISAFGGDPNRVTIFGQGAGGTSTSMHAVSELSKDLFHQYISQSGDALPFWGYQDIDEYKKYANYLGDYLNCSANNSRDLVDCLRDVDAYSIVDSYSIFDDNLGEFFTWRPTNEPEELEGAFLTMDPVYKLLIDGIKDCPAIVGNVLDEGLLLTAEFYANDTAYDAIARDPFSTLKFYTEIFFDTETSNDTIKNIQDFYFDDVQPTDKKAFIQNLTNFITDVGFRKPTEIQTGIMNQKTRTPFYLYTFAYRGTYSNTIATIGSNENVGVAHFDDLIYLFPVRDPNYEPNDSDERMIDVMVDFWTSFAHTGTPTSQNAPEPNVWKPYTYEKAKYLKIGGVNDPTDIQLCPKIDDRLAFWDNYRIISQ